MSNPDLNFRSLFIQFDEDSVKKRALAIDRLKNKSLPSNDRLIRIYDDLLFALTHPASENEKKEVWKILIKIEQKLRKDRDSLITALENSGLPFTPTTGQFSWELLCWLINRKEIKIVPDFSHFGSIAPSEILRPLLPTPLRYEHGAEQSWDDLLSSLQIFGSNPLSGVLHLFDSSQLSPLMRDVVFGQLQLYVSLYPKSGKFSRMRNFIDIPKTFYHKEIQRKYNFAEILNAILPTAINLSEGQKNEVAGIIRYSLALLARETDPATYMDPEHLLLYHLERGISIAIYGMVPERQLPFESYIGFTLFKNGYPAAYGGAWVFGHRARFGINIFETFRGGESGIFFSQILRVYAKCFEIDHFEIESYQFGADNPDGIKSGAYWFYYKHGFRSVDKALRKLAEKESFKIQKNTAYRTSTRTLQHLAESNMELLLNAKRRPDVTAWVSEIRTCLKTQWRIQDQPEKQAIQELRKELPELPADRIPNNIISEWALFRKTIAKSNKISGKQISRLIQLRSSNMLGYQEKLRLLITRIEDDNGD